MVFNYFLVKFGSTRYYIILYIEYILYNIGSDGHDHDRRSLIVDPDRDRDLDRDRRSFENDRRSLENDRVK